MLERLLQLGVLRLGLLQDGDVVVLQFDATVALGSLARDISKQGYSFEGSIKTTSEFSRKRSNTICFPSGVISKVRMAPRF